MKIHYKITTERIIRLITRRNRTLDNPGLCTHCGKTVPNCEPDAREYDCPECGQKKTVFAPEELLEMGLP